jgi:hypothetical protein
MHSCLKLNAIAPETLQATANLFGLLEYDYIVAVFRQHRTSRQSPKTTSDYYAPTCHLLSPFNE